MGGTNVVMSVGRTSVVGAGAGIAPAVFWLWAKRDTTSPPCWARLYHFLEFFVKIFLTYLCLGPMTGGMCILNELKTFRKFEVGWGFAGIRELKSES